MYDGLPQLALSIRQPWAWAILNAGKEVENRSWLCRKRGPICIHAAKGMTRHEFDDFTRVAHDVTFDRPMPAGMLTPDFEEFVRGGIVGVAEIVDCVSRHSSPWFSGPFGIVLANVRPVDFIPVKGALGFFDWRANMAVSAHG